MGLLNFTVSVLISSCCCLLFLGQFFEFVEEAVWAVEVLKSTGLPVAVTMCISEMGDSHGVSCGDCAVKLAQAGTYPVMNYFCSGVKHIFVTSSQVLPK